MSEVGEGWEMTTRTGYAFGKLVLDQWLKAGGLRGDPSLGKLEHIINASVAQLQEALAAQIAKHQGEGSA